MPPDAASDVRAVFARIGCKHRCLRIGRSILRACRKLPAVMLKLSQPRSPPASPCLQHISALAFYLIDPGWTCWYTVDQTTPQETYFLSCSVRTISRQRHSPLRSINAIIALFLLSFPPPGAQTGHVRVRRNTGPLAMPTCQEPRRPHYRCTMARPITPAPCRRHCSLRNSEAQRRRYAALLRPPRVLELG
jgi:hypothetical protein